MNFLNSCLFRCLAVWLGLLFLAVPAHAATASGEAIAVEAPLIVANRAVMTFRSEYQGLSPAVRASRARATIDNLLLQARPGIVSQRNDGENQLILIDGIFVFAVQPGDLASSEHLTSEQVAAQSAARLHQALVEIGESRTWEAMARSAALAGLFTAILGLALWGLSHLRSRLLRRLARAVAPKITGLQISGLRVFDGSHLIALLQRLLRFSSILLVALLLYEWLSAVLTLFPYTRPWGERLNELLLEFFGSIALAIFGALPGLGVAITIFILARLAVDFLGKLLERIGKTGASPDWLGADTLPTTRRLISAAIWLFALAMAYPYLPGAQTEAFKGLSVLLGLMISLGATSIVGQGAAGLIMTYTRTMRPGEYVRIGEHEGTVMRLGMFTTTIRTGLGEELTLPNSLITGTVTKNYSRTVEGPGYVIDTTVTIGYDTPWRQVEALLTEAAKRTPGIRDTPAPHVYQTALSDFYPEYRLVAQAVPTQPVPRAEVLSRLHANIQDVFNEYGVQIMSPHYLSDPARPKLVLPGEEAPPPAMAAETPSP